MANASATPITNSGFRCSALCDCGESLQPPKVDERQHRALRLDVRFAEIERESGAEQHQRDADGDVR